ncbi:unnamed protein product [Lactuca saligna]|uniref:Uncharacterized protein n=1 Tax=Lactuca saligna TaxID=75948 RepID=A0AA36E3Q5_LACSI|nr:unnamed protein product [Lactuca saligna]
MKRKSNVETIVVSLQLSTPEQIVVSLPLISTIETSHDQGTSIIVSSTFSTSTIDTSTTLPPFVSNPIASHSSTFDNILNEPITTLFSSQSTEPLVTHDETHSPIDDDENVFDGTSDDIKFDVEEEEILDNMLLTGKQFEILNQKLNSLLQIQANGRGKNSISSLEMDILLKRQENRLHDEIQNADRNNEKRVKNQLSTFCSNLNTLRM